MGLLDLFTAKPKALKGVHTVVKDGEKTVIRTDRDTNSTITADVYRKKRSAATKAYKDKNMSDPAFAEKTKEAARRRWANLSPAQRENIRATKRARHRVRMATDPEYAQRKLMTARMSKRRRKAADPDFVARENARRLARIKSLPPEKYEEMLRQNRERARLRWATDPAWREREKERKRAYEEKRKAAKRAAALAGSGQAEANIGADNCRQEHIGQRRR